MSFICKITGEGACDFKADVLVLEQPSSLFSVCSGCNGVSFTSQGGEEGPTFRDFGEGLEVCQETFSGPPNHAS